MVTHGTKMASLVLAVAPQARILDLALLPSHILNLRDVGVVTGFLSWAVAAILDTRRDRFPGSRLDFPAYRGPWVLNNSWAVYNLSTDFPPGSFLNYGSNPNHPLNLAVAAAAAPRHRRRRLRRGELRPVLPGRSLRRRTDRRWRAASTGSPRSMMC